MITVQEAADAIVSGVSARSVISEAVYEPRKPHWQQAKGDDGDDVEKIDKIHKIDKIGDRVGYPSKSLKKHKRRTDYD